MPATVIYRPDRPIRPTVTREQVEAAVDRCADELSCYDCYMNVRAESRRAIQLTISALGIEVEE